MSIKKYINCPNCSKMFQIPDTEKLLKITCSSCNTVFFNHTINKRHKNKYKKILLGAILSIISLLVLFSILPLNAGSHFIKSILPNSISSNWITIPYGDLVNKSELTHNGETVGEVINDLSKYTDDQKGLVQIYLEPHSILCHDALLNHIKNDNLSLANILDYYPVGSEQPVWVDLFREGHYQIYFNTNLIRVFLKGTDADDSFEKYKSVIRHPINDIMNSPTISIKKAEIYVFNNDYEKLELRLNTTPKVIAIDKLDLKPKKKSIDLESIENFLNQGVILEAVEVDDNNDLFFYGRKSKTKTIASYPLSLPDISVIYRSIFHYGNNAPYISLDKHEDNRYAKVNFGGNLANTRVGNVVLEADKLFKTLSTGLDPNTHQLVKSKIIKGVPNFLTEDERSLTDNSEKGKMQIRYWFYPDSIGTVTDGSIGAVLTNKFLADVERMDIKLNPSKATKNTIEHLNKNFEQYENVFETFDELSTVGTIMALINWLKGMGMDEKIELDELLAVKIPSFTTPDKTKKMLAITLATHSQNVSLNSRNISEHTKVYYISNLLDSYSSSNTDDFYLDVAKKYYTKINSTELAPSNYREIKASIDYYNNIIKNNEATIEKVNKELERDNYNLDSYNTTAVNNYNEKVNRYNRLLKKNESDVSAYNSKINQLNDYKLTTNSIFSIGGGINLEPRSFKSFLRDKYSPKIKRINEIKSKLKTIGKISKYENWIRSNPINGSARINVLPISSLAQ